MGRIHPTGALLRLIVLLLDWAMRSPGLFSTSTTVHRRLRAEERAQLVPVLMIFPTVLFLFPAFILVILAPALLKLMVVVQGMGGVIR